MNQISFPRISIVKNGEIIAKLPEFTSPSTITVGRHNSCNVTIDDKQISRLHVSLEIQSKQVLVLDHQSTNKTRIDERTLPPNQSYPITKNTDIKLATGPYYIKIEFPLVIAQDQQLQEEENEIITQLNRKGRVTIGRDPDCDIILDSLLVSRKHAIIERIGGRYEIEDLNSTNGTYINGKIIEGRQVIDESDQISIGSVNIFLQSGTIDITYSIIADNIEKVYPGGNVGLRKLSLKIKSGEFVALMGPSGCGKSTLLKGLNGANPVTSGGVTVRGMKLNKENFKLLKQSIGYVPQDDIVHKNLSVNKTMYYAAKLRVATDVSDIEIYRRIDDILTSLNINDPILRKRKVKQLSGGQRKRVSIAVELLNDPDILFLDEPTSPLDPETIEDFLNSIQGLIRNGMTVIMVTHKPSDLHFVDKVIFLSKGGYLTYFDKKDKLLDYFSADNINNVYAELKDEEKGQYWNSRWVNSNPQSDVIHKAEELNITKSSSSLRQLFWLTLRYTEIKWNDKGNVLLLLLQPIFIAGLIAMLFNDFQPSVLFLTAVCSIWFGVSNAAKEIVDEIPIYERERMVNLRIGNYLLSKIIVLFFISVIQSLLFISILNLRYNTFYEIGDSTVLLNPGADGIVEYFKFYGFWPISWLMIQLSISATLFGLLLSAIFKNTEEVMTVIPISLIPQIVLANIVVFLDEKWKIMLSYLTLGRWGTEGFFRITVNEFEAQKDITVISDPNALSIFEKGESMLAPPLENPLLGSAEVVVDSVEKDELMAVNPIDFYSFNNENNFLEGENTYCIAITILSIISFVALYHSLKRKDKNFV